MLMLEARERMSHRIVRVWGPVASMLLCVLLVCVSCAEPVADSLVPLKVGSTSLRLDKGAT